MKDIKKWALLFVLETALMPYCGYLEAKLWNWFVAELFGGFQMTLWHAVGLSLTISAFRSRYRKSDTDYPWYAVIVPSILVTLLFGLGYAVHLVR